MMKKGRNARDNSHDMFIDVSLEANLEPEDAGVLKSNVFYDVL